jgi:two-component system invasion response regulator UvrY
MTKILIADDHSIVRKGLVFQCRTEFGYQCVDEVSNGNELMEALKRTAYTHLILDLVMTDGSSLDILGSIRTLYPSLNILIFSAKPKKVYGATLEKYGVRDYIEKDAPEDLTIRQLRQFLGSTGNKTPVTPSTGRSDNSVFPALAKREMEVLHYWLEGLTGRQIAKQLNISDQAVSTYKSRIHEKTNTASFKELAELAALHQFKN